MKLNELDAWILANVRKEPGITAMGLAVLRREGEATKGYYHPISAAVARLRRHGLLEDVAERCKHCKRALTRGQRNVPLYLTREGYQLREAA